MLTAQYLDGSAESIREIYSGLQSKIMADIAKRIAGFAYIGHDVQYNNYKLKELTESQAYIAQEIARTSKTSKKAVKAFFRAAGTKSMEAAIELIAAKNKDKLSADVFTDFSGRLDPKLDDGAIQTLNSLRKLCRFSAVDAAAKLNQYLDRRQLLAQAGIDSEDHARESVLKDFAAEGIKCGDYGSGMEAAAESVFITALNQTIGKISLELAAILQTDLVQVSGHADARPEHALWQYGIYSISGESTKYRKLAKAAGYGTGAGLCGWNCRHTFFPLY